MSTRVLHVIARMNVGGTARYVAELVEKIPESKLATGFVQNSEIEDSCVDKLQVVRVHGMGRKISVMADFRAWFELRKIIKETSPDIVHTHTFKAGLIGRLIRGKHKRVHTFHGHLFYDQSFSKVQKLLITAAERYLAHKTDLLISVGDKVGVELRAAGIGTRKSWVSIPPGIDPLPKIDKVKAQRSLGLGSETIHVGWMARMARVKNPALLLDVAQNLPHVSFVMAGGGDLLESIKSNAPKNVHVLGWADAATFWSAVDCAVSTSDNEGMPIALIEAQLAGVPVIATDVGSNAEVIENGVTGIITTKDIKSLILAIESVIKNKKGLQLMGERGRARALSKFSTKKMIVQHIEVYQKISSPIAMDKAE